MEFGYTTNLQQSGPVRRETFLGREHIVIPTVAVVPGVLNGELLPPEEVEDSAEAWEGQTVVLGHPHKHGKKISANLREILESEQAVGRFFNTNVENGTLKGEIWADVAALTESKDGQRTLQVLEAWENDEDEAQMLEVSTAYWRHVQNGSGVHKGKSYEGIQRNLRPNHLAILLHESGACSVHDGCGAPRVNAEEDDMNPWKRLKGLYTSAKHGMSHDEIRHRLLEEISNRETAANIFIGPVYDDYVVYDREVGEGEFETFRRDYKVENSDSDPEIELDEPVEVRRIVSFEPVQNSAGTSPTQEDTMDRDEVIAALVANDDLPFSEDELKSFDDSKLTYLSEQAAASDEEEPAGGDDDEEEEEPGKQETEPAQNKDSEGQDDGLSSDVVKTLNTLGSKGILGLVTHIAQQEKEAQTEQEQMVAALAANERCVIPKETLQDMDLVTLRAVERQVSPTGYVGGAVRTHSSKDEDEVPTPKPVLLANDQDEKTA